MGGSRGVAERFDYVLVMRNDVLWQLNVLDWLANYSTFNFYAHCEPFAKDEAGGKNCVWDTVHLMPSSIFSTFETIVTTECFGYSGHSCYAPMLLALQNISGSATIGFISE